MGSKMKKMFISFFLLVFSVLFFGCGGNDDKTSPDANETSAPEATYYQQVAYYGSVYSFDAIDCYVAGSVGTTPVVYMLAIDFENGQGQSMSFSVQDSENSPENLVSVGEHNVSEQHRGAIDNMAQSHTFSIGDLTEKQFAIVWDEVNLSQYLFSGKGYIHIKERIELECADQIWVGGKYAYPGDPEYDEYYENYCAPGYFFPAQKIMFECVDGHYPY